MGVQVPLSAPQIINKLVEMATGESGGCFRFGPYFGPYRLRDARDLTRPRETAAARALCWRQVMLANHPIMAVGIDPDDLT